MIRLEGYFFQEGIFGRCVLWHGTSDDVCYFVVMADLVDGACAEGVGPTSMKGWVFSMGPCDGVPYFEPIPKLGGEFF